MYIDHTTYDTDNCPPVNLDNLLIQLSPQVGPKWYQFGVAARIEREVLDKFAEQCSPQDCIVEMLYDWLKIVKNYQHGKMSQKC